MKIILAALVIIGSAYAHPTTVKLATKPPAPQCDETLWKHVYVGGRANQFATAKDRLKIIDPCKTITGRMVTMVSKPDGDIHIQIKLDPGQSDLLNARNRQAKGGQHGYLVIEPICQKEPTHLPHLRVVHALIFASRSRHSHRCVKTEANTLALTLKSRALSLRTWSTAGMKSTR